MTKRAIICTCDNGEVWAIPLSVVADDRAKYYAGRDKDTTYQIEFDYVMRDSYAGQDWFINNMYPESVEAHFIQLSEPDTGQSFSDKINGAEKEMYDIDFPEVEDVKRDDSV